jgi:hypothetical protein
MFCFFISFGQKKIEHLGVNWPGEYNWKIIRQEKNENRQSVMIIPGGETTPTPSIVGSMTSYRGTKMASVAEIINNYRSRIDVGSILSEVEADSTAKHIWVIFKIETPSTEKYPQPESDLYYIVQGEYALYENYVAIKEASLSAEFVKKWTDIFKTSEVKIDQARN